MDSTWSKADRARLSDAITGLILVSTSGLESRAYAGERARNTLASVFAGEGIARSSRRVVTQACLYRVRMLARHLREWRAQAKHVMTCRDLLSVDGRRPDAERAACAATWADRPEWVRELRAFRRLATRIRSLALLVESAP